MVGAPVLDRPYAERRIVLVGPSTDEKRSTPDWRTFAEQVPTSALWFLGGIGVAEAVRRGMKASQPDGSIVIALDEATQQLRFPPGHPLLKHAYVGHPLDAPRYVPLAGFHQLLL